MEDGQVARAGGRTLRREHWRTGSHRVNLEDVALLATPTVTLRCLIGWLHEPEISTLVKMSVAPLGFPGLLRPSVQTG